MPTAPQPPSSAIHQRTLTLILRGSMTLLRLVSSLSGSDPAKEEDIFYLYALNWRPAYSNNCPNGECIDLLKQSSTIRLQDLSENPRNQTSEMKI